MKTLKTLLKIILTILGIIIFIFCIAEEIDGVGRFACIFMGTLFTSIGSFINIEKTNKN